MSVGHIEKPIWAHAEVFQAVKKVIADCSDLSDTGYWQELVTKPI